MLLKSSIRTSSGIMAFGTAMTGWAAASLGEAEAVGAVLENLSTRYYYRNFASSHNSGAKGPEIFNTDISGGMPALVIEMLIQSKPGEITLLPALPAQYASGKLSGASCRGQVTVHELAWSPEGVKVKLQSAKDQKLNLRVRIGGEWKTISLDLVAGKPVEQAFPNK